MRHHLATFASNQAPGSCPVCSTIRSEWIWVGEFAFCPTPKRKSETNSEAVLRTVVF